MTFKLPDITIQLPPPAWLQQGVNGQEGDHTASPPGSPMKFARSKSEQELERTLHELFGMKFGPNDPTPERHVEKEDGKKRYSYDSPIARPSPNVSPQKVSPAKPFSAKPSTPMAPINEDVTMSFDTFQSNSPPVIRRSRVAPTPHHTPVSPDKEKVERVALGKLKPKALFQNNTINKS